MQIPLAQSRAKATKIKEEKDKTKEKKSSASDTPEVSARGRRGKPVRSYVDDDLDDIPLKNIKKEVAPQETLSMERYYFGQIGGVNNPAKMAIAVQVSYLLFDINGLLRLKRNIQR